MTNAPAAPAETDATAYVDAMVRSYAATALWSSHNELHDIDPDEHSENLDGDYDIDDIDAATMDDFRKDCRDFFEANRADLAGIDAGQAGHDFWLTRNRHGAGFWDRGLGEIGDRLTDSAHPYGEVYLWVDNGHVRDN